jgi:hypothetical protein
MNTEHVEPDTHLRETLSFCSAIGMGLGVSTGHPLGIAAAAAMPLVCLSPETRKGAFKSSLAYYAAALWPIIPGLEAYWKSETQLIPLVLWIATAILLSLPWTMAWTSRRVNCFWRAPLALLATILPPLGVVGLASPVTGAGYLFPGSGWAGLVTVALLPGIVLSTKVLDSRLRSAVLFVTICFLVGVAIGEGFGHRGDPEPPRGWVAVDTHFGDVSEPYRDFAAAQFIQRKAVGSSARVVIFPESVVPRWSEATESFWSKTLNQSRRRGQTLAIGAGFPAQTATPKDESQKLNDLKAYDFGAAIDTLRSMDMQEHHPAVRSPKFSDWTKPQAESIDNTMLIVGAESGTFYQRVPVPLGMWRPSSPISVPLRLGAPGVVALDHQRAAVLICYEQLLTFPILASMRQHPTVIVGISNTFWVDHTSIPLYQVNAMRSWAKLFRLPYLLAVNS